MQNRAAGFLSLQSQVYVKKEEEKPSMYKQILLLHVGDQFMTSPTHSFMTFNTFRPNPSPLFLSNMEIKSRSMSAAAESSFKCKFKEIEEQIMKRRNIRPHRTCAEAAFPHQSPPRLIRSPLPTIKLAMVHSPCSKIKKHLRQTSGNA